MTIPTRPAPAPPQMRNFNSNGTTMAVDDANARLEQLRLQLQQQQQQQQQQKITIKLPPPPKGNVSAAGATTTFPTRSNQQQNFNGFDDNVSGSSITRKFPKVRYAPTTNWNDSPFEMNNTTSNSTTTNGNNFKKVPPPRPPPPKVTVNGNQRSVSSSTTITTTTSTKILTNIFNRKKSSNVNNAKQNSAARLYGVSSGNYAVNPTGSHSNYESTAAASSSATFTNSDWNAAWNTTNSAYGSTSATITSQNNQEAQLISFDSPPSSPTFTQKSNSDCVSVDSFSSDSNFSSPQNGSVSQPESGFEDDFSATSRSRPATTSPLDPWEAFDACGGMNSNNGYTSETAYCSTASIGTAPVRNLNALNTRGANDNPLCNGKSLLPPTTSLYMPTIIKPKISQKPKAPKPPAFKNGPQHQVMAGAALHTPPSPPMPQGAPPPPPTGVSLLDVISGKVDPIHLSNASAYAGTAGDNETPYGIALYDFEGAEEGDLSFRENDKIDLLERVSFEWYRGRTRAGCEGILPSNYIEVKIPIPTSTAATTTPMSTAVASSTSTALPKVRCLYNFPAEVDGDLPLKENDMVTILHRINEDWLFGELNGRKGQFPANFLEYVPTDIPLP